jgi:hypothetical protein
MTMKCRRTRTGIRASQGKAICFATEVVRACLSQPTTNVRLCGLWSQMDMIIKDAIDDGVTSGRTIEFRILIASGNYVRVNCTVYSVKGVWTSSDVEVVLLDETGRRVNADSPRWYFGCWLNTEGRIDVRSKDESHHRQEYENV